MIFNILRHCAFSTGIALLLWPTLALAQGTEQQPATTDTPATTQNGQAPVSGEPTGADLPAVEVIQDQPKAKAAKAAPKQKQKATPVAQPVVSPEPLPPEAVSSPSAPVSTAAGRANGDLVPMSPSGGEIPVGKYPGGVSTVSSTMILDNGRVETQDALQKHVPGVILMDAGGSTFRTQLDYRGFGAGSITGFPQGVAVYQNGVRINEVFGDVVNWDLIPSNAISDITILSGNPVYGLNAIGGGASILMKDGFSFQGVEIDVMGGSFGRKQISTQVGMQSGPAAIYFAGQKIMDDGYRDFSDADLERMYTDLGFRGSAVEMHFNLTWAGSSAGVVAASPEELLNLGWERTFTSPQTTDLELLMPSINASVKATDTLTFSGLAYYRRYRSNLIDGNVLEGEECGEVLAENPGATTEADFNADNVCSEELENNEIQQLRDLDGNPIDGDAAGGEPFGVIDRINQKAESWGGSVQAVEKSDLFGFKNQFLFGASYDRGSVRYGTSSEIGTIGPRFVVDGSGIILGGPDDFIGRDVDVQTEYVGVYFTNTLDLTDQLAVTVGGRYNYAAIDMVDLTGEFDGITRDHSFERFNPSVGATYEFMPGISLYAGYSEANRAPTPAELACANPENPCPIESFLTDDPPLEQVVSDTWEAGLRGRMKSFDGSQRFDWGVGLFRTQNTDDILFVSAAQTGRGYFFNAGDTLRQGVEAGMRYSNSVWSLYAGYSYVSATFETANEFQSPAHPLGTPCVGDPDTSCINVSPGDNIPGIPAHRIKAGFDYWVTDRWKVGADLVAASGQYHLGDEANLLQQVGGYTRVDVSTSYQLTDNVQIYGFVNNIFDQRYGLFGTLFEADEAPTDPVGPGFEFTNPRSIVPAPPVAAYGGVKVTF
ncbi:TonB-dependent receptor [Filomicrobium sp.]|uniref:TonB-dependent receptor n=1 Tax=Filomicrobium sp. TaxID=2024831 RepID=UPI00258C4FAE|nr:TonB-dependent receptor [Filomicrobium sp.]MCV0369800.1 TonB-dependent receptor [Filomicrobium sp.]